MTECVYNSVSAESSTSWNYQMEAYAQPIYINKYRTYIYIQEASDKAIPIKYLDDRNILVFFSP